MQRLYKVTVDAGQTLSVGLAASDPQSTNELFVRYGDVATPSQYDFGAVQVLSASPSTLVPTTQAGDYYILIQGDSGTTDSPVTLTVMTLPFTISDITKDQGGDSKWVTTTITGRSSSRGPGSSLCGPGSMSSHPRTIRSSTRRRSSPSGISLTPPTASTTSL